MSFGNYSNLPSTHGYTTQGYTTQGYTTQGYTTQGYTTQGYTTQGYTTQGYTTQGYSTQGMTTQAYTPNSSTGTMGYSPVAGSTNGYTVDGNSRVGSYWDDMAGTVADWGGTYSTLMDSAKTAATTAARNSKAIRTTVGVAAVISGKVGSTVTGIAGKLGVAGAAASVCYDGYQAYQGNGSWASTALHAVEAGLCYSGVGTAVALSLMGIEGCINSAVEMSSTNGAWNSGLSGAVISGGSTTGAGFVNNVDTYLRYGL